MAHFVWIVRALSPVEGGWIRNFGHFHSEEDAWKMVLFFWPLIVSSQEDRVITIEVVKTIAFRKLTNA